MPAITYSEPRLYHYNYDMSKLWYVEFTFKNPANGKQERKQIRGKINSFKTKDARLKDANSLIKYWSDLLSRGEFKQDHGIATIDAPKTVGDATARILELKKATLKAKSARGYTDIANRFQKWMKSKGYNLFPLYAFNNNMARGYLDYLILDGKAGGVTHNNHLNVLRAFFYMMKEKWPDHMADNPFKGIKKLTTETGGNIAYSTSERDFLIKYFRSNNIRIYYCIQFMFHCFIRKTELTYIKVGDINWENGTITINSYAAKSRKQDSVTIPEGLFPVMKEMGLDTAPKHHYIFGSKLKTCEQRLTRPDTISDMHLSGKIEAGMPSGDGKTFYSWKHTGVIAYWSIINDPWVMMRQLRHSDLKTTMVYMKSLGLMANKAFTAAKITL